ncbi:hypothetical protein ACG3SL_07375 [Sphingomonas sp. CJ20]
MSDPTRREPLKQCGIATAEQGFVLLDGPNGVAIAMTPEAAQGTAHSLLAAVDEAARQRATPDRD